MIFINDDCPDKFVLSLDDLGRKRCSFPILSVDDIQVFVSNAHISLSRQKQTYKVKYISQDKPRLLTSKLNIPRESTHGFFLRLKIWLHRNLWLVVLIPNLGWATIRITISSWGERRFMPELSKRKYFEPFLKERFPKTKKQLLFKWLVF